MLYIVWAVVIAAAVVLFIFTGIWGGLAWIVVAAVAGLVFGLRWLREGRPVEATPREPTGQERKARGGAGTANERVGQG
jgi:hypothetical protein